MSKSKNRGFHLYKDIQGRTGGEIYIGVVGPVRTGKSTFIKRFMDVMILEDMEESGAKTRMIDELPQSAQGITIMTTEPKFVPQHGAKVALKDGTDIQVRLVDCVGFLVDGANGYMEGDELRMVQTPWTSEAIPFTKAAEIGTTKVIREHATIGVVVTTDGSFLDIPRESYLEPERHTIEEMKEMGKCFVVVLNSQKPYSQETIALKENMEKEYQVPVIPVNCKQMTREDMEGILDEILYEFPVSQIDFQIPSWTEMLPCCHEVKEKLVARALELLSSVTKMRELYQIAWLKDDEMISKEWLYQVSLETGEVQIRMEVKDNYYYEYLSQMTGTEIHGEYQLLQMVRDLSKEKLQYEKIREAFESVTGKGYGVVMPTLSDITMENPVLIRHGNKYGVKMKACSPSIHMIRANIETEIAPIVGSEEQAKDLIAYIEESQNKEEGVWKTNIFGKSIGELMEEGIKNKIMLMDDTCQLKLQDTMQKIVNDMNSGMICIII